MPAGKPSLIRFSVIEALTKLFAFGIPLGAMVVLNQAFIFFKFGGWFNTGYPIANLLTFNARHWLTAFAGNLISPGRGILIFFPMSILSLGGLKRLIATDQWFARTVFSFLVGNFLFYPIWRTWDAGISWGPRFLIPMVPYLCLLAYAALPPLLSPRYKVLVSVLLILGVVGALQGLLFDFLHFYGSLGLSAAQFDQQTYHFSVFTSPLFAGWKGLAHISSYDIKWFHLERAIAIKLVFPMFGLVCLSVLAKAWFNFFRSPAEPAAVKSRSQAA